MALSPAPPNSRRSVARALGFRVRSLHRALAAEGAKFNAIVDDVRRDFAERYLARPSLDIGEISYLVGFGDTSAFFEAFERWTGMRKRAARERRVRPGPAGGKSVGSPLHLLYREVRGRRRIHGRRCSGAPSLAGVLGEPVPVVVWAAFVSAALV